MTPSDQPTPNPETKPEATAEQPAVPQQPPAPARPEKPRPPKERKPRQHDRPPVLNVQDLPTGPRLRDLDKDIEAELAAAMADFSDKDLAEPEQKDKRQPATKPGERKKGRIISIHGGDVFIDVPGGRSQGFIPIQQFDKPPAIGTEVEFDIEGFDSANGLLRLTRKGAAVHVDWSSVAIGQTVEARVTGTNKGGLAVEVNGIRGFLPISQIDLYRVENAEQFVNQRLVCLVTEVDPAERNLVVSRRALLEREREQEREKFWAEAHEGQVLTGTVRSIKPFGVFVDLGGADGLVPISEMAWARVAKPEDLVSLGQKVQVKIMRLDPDARRISLSLKQLAASPWDDFSERHHSGERITGKVTRIAEYGAFVELEPGVEGLIHISELGQNRVRRVRDVVQEGQDVEVQIVNIDKAQRRIGLSLKALADAARKAEEQEAIAELEARKERQESGAEPPQAPRKRNYELRGGV
jgi:small subunit ribosomal protein S1